MTATKGSRLPVHGEIYDEDDIGLKMGYGVKTRITVEGTPEASTILEGLWASIKQEGDLPVWASVTHEWTGNLWPFTPKCSRYLIKYQAVHMSEGTPVWVIVQAVLVVLPALTAFLLVVLKTVVVLYVILKAEAVLKWLSQDGPPSPGDVAKGAGILLLAAVILSGDSKK